MHLEEKEEPKQVEEQLWSLLLCVALRKRVFVVIVRVLDRESPRTKKD